jgi:hypothetical protein
MRKRCIAQGTLPARPVVPQAPWSSQRTALARPAVQAAVQGGRTRHRQAGTQAGAAPVAGAPAETRRSTLLSGAR